MKTLSKLGALTVYIFTQGRGGELNQRKGERGKRGK
jgi:hypothetical protein